jgi:hypothetical protein
MRDEGLAERKGLTMNVFRSLGRQERERFGYRTGAVLAVLFCTLAFAPALSAPAGAAVGRSFGPHNPGAIAHVSPRPHDVAALTQTNWVVTDLASNDSTVYEWSNVTPVTQGSNCDSGSNSPICVSFGSGVGPDGGAIAIVPGMLTPGTVYDSIGGPASVSVAGQTCSQGLDPANAAVSSFVELDQYVVANSTMTTLAVQIDCTTATTDISGTIAYNIFPTDPEDGYYLFGQQGEIAGFGNDNYLVYLDGAQYYNLNAPIVAMAPTPDAGGYWMVGSDGGVFSSGDAGFYGSTGNIHLNKPVVGMASTPDGKGYWFVASDGGIFSYGDAGFFGSRGGQPLNKPIVGMAATPDGQGYWLVASDGGIFSYGDAAFYGSTGSINLNKPIVSMTPTSDGHGYWFVASDGGVFDYGDAGFYGSAGSLALNSPIVGMTATPDGHGYWIVASDGGLFTYGDAQFDGSLGGTGIDDVAGMSLGL